PTEDSAMYGRDDKNFWGHQVRIGDHPGVRVYVPPAPPPPPPPPAPPPAPPPPPPPAPAAAAAAPPAASGPGAYAHGAGGVQPLHGAGESALDGDGDADGFDRLRGDLSLDRALGDPH